MEIIFYLLQLFFLVTSPADLPARLLDNHTSLPVDPIFSAWQCDWEQQPKQLLFLWEKKRAEHLVWLKSFKNHPLKYSQVRSWKKICNSEPRQVFRAPSAFDSSLKARLFFIPKNKQAAQQPSNIFPGIFLNTDF